MWFTPHEPTRNHFHVLDIVRGIGVELVPIEGDPVPHIDTDLLVIHVGLDDHDPSCMNLIQELEGVQLEQPLMITETPLLGRVGGQHEVRAEEHEQEHHDRHDVTHVNSPGRAG